MLLMENQKNYLPLILMFIDTCSDPLGLMVSGYSEDREDTLPALSIPAPL